MPCVVTVRSRSKIAIMGFIPELLNLFNLGLRRDNSLVWEPTTLRHHQLATPHLMKGPSLYCASMARSRRLQAREGRLIRVSYCSAIAQSRHLNEVQLLLWPQEQHPQPLLHCGAYWNQHTPGRNDRGNRACLGKWTYHRSGNPRASDRRWANGRCYASDPSR